MADKLIFGYWGIRGKAQVPRLLLSYTGANWQDKTYTDPVKWFGTDKQSLGFDFPNLPYLIDGDLKLTQTAAIERYIIERYIIARSEHTELLGKTPKDQAKVNEIIGVLDDVRTNVAKLFFDKDYEAKLKETWEKVQPKFNYLEKFVGDKEWSLGYLTLVDFIISELSNYFAKLYPEEYKTYPSIERINNGINNLEKVKEYYQRENSVKGPFLPPAYAVIQL